MPKSPRKRAASVAGFLRKILPSNRPEQGGTLRESQNNSGDSGYIDLGLNPEELTQWNIAQDLTPPVHRRAVSLSPTKPRALLHSKEQARQQRRELKASGDYLPVTGFNPWTGGWDVVTPTDTISSDMTSLSTKENIARLRQRVLNAKLAFDSEKKRRESNKAQAKLEKIEKLKEDLRQDQPMKWRQHRGQWSSAAEPKLSPIAQSLNSSTPSKDKSVAGPSSRRHQHRLDHSSDTIIHTSTRRDSNHVSFVNPIVHTAPNENGEPFLWKHRRGLTDPGGPLADQAIVTSSSMTETMMRSQSLNALHGPDHFAGLVIPDYHLGLPSLERDKTEMSTEESTPTQETTGSNKNMPEGSPILSPLANVGNQEMNHNQDTAAAIATSSPSKSKGLMRRPSIPRRWPPSLMATGQAKSSDSVPQSLAPLVRGESAFIPTTTTIGSVPEVLSRPLVQRQLNQVDLAAENINVGQVNLTSPPRDRQRSLSLSVPTRKEKMMSFHHIKPQNSLPNIGRHLTTPKTVTASTGTVTPRKSFLGECSPVAPRLSGLIRRGVHPNVSPDVIYITTSIPTKATACQTVPPHQSSDESADQDAAVVQAAARAAMLRSRARVANDPAFANHHQNKSVSRTKTGFRHPYDQSSSPTKKQHHNGDAGIGGLSSSRGRKTDAVTVAYMSCLVAADLVLGVGCAWWTVVRPAFDKDSPLWKRRVREESTLGDLGIFLSAGLFCFVGSVLGWYGLKVLKWLLF